MKSESVDELRALIIDLSTKSDRSKKLDVKELTKSLKKMQKTEHKMELETLQSSSSGVKGELNRLVWIEELLDNLLNPRVVQFRDAFRQRKSTKQRHVLWNKILLQFQNAIDPCKSVWETSYFSIISGHFYSPRKINFSENLFSQI